MKYSTDTRTIQPGEIYVAIRGERFDGHRFIPQALEKGAAGLVIDRDISHLAIPEGLPVTRVEDCTTYLAEMAKQRLQQYKTTCVAVTGSVGKTTTRSAIAAVLGEISPVLTPEGNLNTLLGLSLTVLNHLESPEQMFVYEAGAYQRGDIALICRYFPPHVAVVTNVHPVHLERMGSMENIKLAKQELVEAVPEGGCACLNYDDPRVRSMAAACKGRVIFYGRQGGAQITPQFLRLDRILQDSAVLGSYRVETILAAVSTGIGLDYPLELLLRGAARIQPEKGRLQKLKGKNGIVLLDDTYNAAPVSMQAALDVLRKLPAEQRIAFLGDMLELGEYEAESHRQVLCYALDVADRIILVGERMRKAAEELHLAHEPGISLFNDSKELAEALARGEVYQPHAGDCVLAKGSAGMRMERVIACLLSPEINPAEVLVRQEAGWQDH